MVQVTTLVGEGQCVLLPVLMSLEYNQDNEAHLQPEKPVHTIVKNKEGSLIFYSLQDETSLD